MIPPSLPTSSGLARAVLSWLAAALARNCSLHCWRARVQPRAVLRALSIAALVVAGSAFAASRLTRNYTPSLPLGIYLLGPWLPVERGAIVDFEIPANARALIADRYLPARFHLLKRVVALEGDIVCFAEGRYRVNGVSISTIARQDSIGRPLPVFAFCGPVPAGAAFVATPASSSLDSRYFGPVSLSALTAATPLWTS